MEKTWLKIFYSDISELLSHTATTSERTQARHDAVWSLLRYGMARAGLSLNAFEQRTSANGKPYLFGAGAPFISLSHSDAAVACAVASVEVGCDIEAIKHIPVRVQKRMFGEVHDSPELSTARWTELESYIKMCDISMRCADFSAPHVFYDFDVGGYHLTACTESECDAPSPERVEAERILRI